MSGWVDITVTTRSGDQCVVALTDQCSPVHENMTSGEWLKYNVVYPNVEY